MPMMRVGLYFSYEVVENARSCSGVVYFGSHNSCCNYSCYDYNFGCLGIYDFGKALRYYGKAVDCSGRAADYTGKTVGCTGMKVGCSYDRNCSVMVLRCYNNKDYYCYCYYYIDAFLFVYFCFRYFCLRLRCRWRILSCFQCHSKCTLPYVPFMLVFQSHFPLNCLFIISIVITNSIISKIVSGCLL